MSEKVLGIIGGVGPMSTIYFEEMITRLTKAKKDQDHLDMIVFNRASIPDRTDFITGKSKDNPLPVMLEDAKKLQSLGVCCITIPCNTAHYFYDAIQAQIKVPIINIITQTVRYIKTQLKQVEKVGILATYGTIAAGSYQLELKKNNLLPVLPDAKTQQQIMRIIYDQVKAGKRVDISSFQEILARMKTAGCDALILGCTELSVIRRDFHLQAPEIVDSLEILALSSLRFCEKSINKEVIMPCADL